MSRKQKPRTVGKQLDGSPQYIETKPGAWVLTGELARHISYVISHMTMQDILKTRQDGYRDLYSNHICEDGA